MRVSIYQPLYWPPLHYFNRMLDVDVFVLLDNAQFTRSANFRNTMQIKGRNNTATMVVPLLHTGKREKIMDIKVDSNQPWQRKHYQALRHAYGKTETWKAEGDGFLSLFYGGTTHKYFRDVYELTLHWAVEMIGGWGRTTKILSSELGIEKVGSPSGWMLDICKHFGATEYLCGGGASVYLDKDAFEKAGIQVIVQDWKSPKYKQQGAGFIPNLSILDFIMNVPEENRRDMLV